MFLRSIPNVGCRTRRQMARKFHPDVNKEPGAEDKFKEIANAYEVLTDDNKRSIYDRRAICPISSI